MAKRKINVQNIEVVLFEKNKLDYISLTDIARYKDDERSDYALERACSPVHWLVFLFQLKLQLWDRATSPLQREKDSYC